MQKPMTGVSGTKPAWEAQKGRGKGEGELEKEKSAKGKRKEGPFNTLSPNPPPFFPSSKSPQPHSTPAMQARTKKVAYKVLNLLIPTFTRNLFLICKKKISRL